jgi:FAD/FMN-containing dehydrogenase
MSVLVDDLATWLDAKGLLTAPDDVAPYCHDWRDKFHGQALAVARPRSTEEVAWIVRRCAERGVAIVPQGGNSGLSGGATPDRSGSQLVLSLARMTAIRAVDPIDNVLVAEAGCILANAQQAAAQVGRLLPLSFGAEGSARLGGAVATNAGGVNVLRYGNTRQLVLGLEVVLPDGTVLDQLSRLRKDNAGYDLKQIFIGSEGTLGVVTAVSLRLFPRIVQTQTAVVQLAGLDHVLDLFHLLNGELGELLSSFELISEAAHQLSAGHLPNAGWPFSEGWAVLVELGTGSAAIDLAGPFEAALGDALERGIIVDAVIAQSDTQRSAFWLVRESITEGERAAGASIKHDISVPISGLPALIAECEAGLPERFPGVRPNIFGHVGDGNVHLNVIVGDASLTGAINAYVHDRVVAAGGSITAEHGVGQLRVDELARYKPAADIDLMRRIKRAIDPAGLMNPGNILRQEP